MRQHGDSERMWRLSVLVIQNRSHPWLCHVSLIQVSGVQSEQAIPKLFASPIDSWKEAASSDAHLTQFGEHKAPFVRRKINNP